jgi:hypothetical protein
MVRHEGRQGPANIVRTEMSRKYDDREHGDDRRIGTAWPGTPLPLQSESRPMQSYDAALMPNDEKVARQIGRIVLILYSSTALMLMAWVAAHIALRTPKAAELPEVAAQPGVPANARPLRTAH